MVQIPVFGKKIDSIEYWPRPGAYGVLINDDGLLATIFTHGWHFLPGGGKEPDESITNCLKRELLEELGCVFDSAEPVGRADEYFQSMVSEEYYLGQGYFFRISGFHIVSEPTDKTHGIEWLSVKKAQTALRHDSQRWALTRALENS